MSYVRVGCLLFARFCRVVRVVYLWVLALCADSVVCLRQQGVIGASLDCLALPGANPKIWPRSVKRKRFQRHQAAGEGGFLSTSRPSN